MGESGGDEMEPALLPELPKRLFPPARRFQRLKQLTQERAGGGGHGVGVGVLLMIAEPGPWASRDLRCDAIEKPEIKAEVLALRLEDPGEALSGRRPGRIGIGQPLKQQAQMRAGVVEADLAQQGHGLFARQRNGFARMVFAWPGLAKIAEQLFTQRGRHCIQIGLGKEDFHVCWLSS
jgi:hypothetical protein